MPEVGRSFRGWPRKCVTCAYRAEGYGNVGTCDYLGITGHARQLISPEAGKNCTAWEPRVKAEEKKKRVPPPPPVPKESTVKVIRAQMRALYDRGLCDAEIALEVGRSKAAVYHWRHRESLPPNGSRDGGSAERAQQLRTKMRQLYDKGLVDQQIAQQLGCAVRTVQSWRRNEKLPSHYKREEK